MGNDGIIRGRSRARSFPIRSRTNGFAHGAISDRDAINLAARYRKYRSLTLGRLAPPLPLLCKGHLRYVNICGINRYPIASIRESARGYRGCVSVSAALCYRFQCDLSGKCFRPRRPGLSHAINSPCLLQCAPWHGITRKAL